jgi:two-component system cell cycle sensor histidine kinase/response regulator CckA
MLSTSEPANERSAPDSRFWAGSPPLLYAVVAAHVVVLALTSAGTWGDAGSSFMQLMAGTLAASACWQASRRSRYFATIFWRLSAATFGLWTFGALLNTVQNLRSAVPDEGQIGIFLIIFLSTAPMFIGSVLSGTADEESKIHWDLILDATQVLVLVLAIHLMLVDIPSMTLGEHGTTKVALRLQDYWRVALAIALAGRALLDHSPATRRLVKPMAIAMSLFAVGSWIGNDLEAFSGWKGARWFDLAWTIPFVMVAFSAASWRQSPVSPAWDRKPAKVETVFLFYLPSVAMPVLLLSMYHEIQFEQILVGLGAMMLSIFCFSLRLFITQKQQSRTVDALRASESRYRKLFERNLAGIYVSTVDDRILDCNQAFCDIFGYTREEILQQPASVLYEGGVQERDALMAEIQQQGPKRGVEHSYVRKDGRKVWTIENYSVTGDENGRRLVEGAMLDVTHRRSLEHQLQQAQKMESIGLLAGGIAHDFNNLLTVMHGYSDLQLEKTAPSDPVHVYAEQINSAADRAAALTRQLLAFSRQQVMQARVVSLNSLLRDFEKLLRRLIGEDIEMRTVFAADLGNVKVDPGQMEQVIMNLVTNARDAMPEGGTLTLETSNITLDGLFLERHPYVEPGPYVRLAVSDTGTGMDAETRERVFDPFFTTKEFGKGTGLGLSTSYGIVKQSQGYIEVYSEVGHGSTFVVYLRRLGPGATPLPTEKALPARRGDETILLVEDDRQVRSLTQSILESYGYTVLAVEDPSQTEAVCEQHSSSIKLLLADMILPKMNGREVARRVATRIPSIRVLYMSGFPTHTAVNQGILEDGIYFLQKPFTAVALASKIREVLDHSDGAHA